MRNVSHRLLRHVFARRGLIVIVTQRVGLARRDIAVCRMDDVLGIVHFDFLSN